MPSRSEQRTGIKPKRLLDRNAPYKFESPLLQRRVSCEPVLSVAIRPLARSTLSALSEFGDGSGDSQETCSSLSLTTSGQRRRTSAEARSKPTDNISLDRLK